MYCINVLFSVMIIDLQIENRTQDFPSVKQSANHIALTSGKFGDAIRAMYLPGPKITEVGSVINHLKT
jgi:hypothetical protein